MLDEQQLNEVYDPGKDYLNAGPGPGPKASKAPTPVKDPGADYIKAPMRGGPTAKLSNVNLNARDVSELLGKTGVPNPENVGVDVETMMANSQSFGEQLGRRAANIIPNIAANIVDMAGNMGALLFEWNDERDYSNVLNEAAANMKDKFGKVHHHDNSTWAIGDSAWWLDNIFQTAEYAGAFAIGGLGIAKVLGGVAELAGGSQFLRGVAQLGTSAAVSYAEAAQGGMQVYKETYDTQFRKHLAAGLDPEEAANKAKHIAAQSAATAAQLGTLLTMGLNVGAYAPWFRRVEDAGLDILAQRVRGSLTSGATMAEVAASVRGLKASDFADRLFHHSSAVDVLKEMGAEGLEEVVQNVSQDIGTELGNKGKTEDFFTQFGELEDIINKSATSQSLLAFTLGAGFGGLQHALIQGMPSQHVEKYVNGVPVQKMQEDGKTPMVNKNGKPVYEKHWVTPRTVETDFSTRRFDTLKEAVAHDFSNFATLQNNLVEAVAKKNMIAADEARDQLFDTAKLHAVKSGLTEPWIKTFEGIAAMTPAEAVSAGLATDESDESYKEKAGDAINDINHLSKAYSTLQKNYGYNESSAPFIDMVFARQADIYSTENRIKRYEKKLIEQEAEEKKMLAGIDPAGFSETLHAFHNKLLSMQAVEKQLIDDHKALMSGDPKTIDRLLRKYRAIGMGDGDRTVPIRDLDRKLKEKQSQLKEEVTQQESALLLTPEYTTWLEKNPGGSFQGFLKEINARNNMLVQNRHGRAQLEMAKTQLQMAKENMSEMTKDKNANKFSRKAEEWVKQMIEEAQAAEIERVKKMSTIAKDKATLARLQKLDKHRIAEKYRTERDNTYDRIDSNTKEISSLFQELEKPGIFNTDKIHVQIRKLQKENKALKTWAEKLDSLYEMNKVDMDTDEELDPEDLAGDTTGKTTANAADAPTTATTEPATAPMPPANSTASAPIITMEDELEAERMAMEEFGMTKAAESTPVETFNTLMSSYNSAIQASTRQMVDGMLNGQFGFSYDFLNAYIDKNFTQVQAHELLIAARNYVEEVMALRAEAAAAAKKEGGGVSGSALKDIKMQSQYEFAQYLQDNHSDKLSQEQIYKLLTVRPELRERMLNESPQEWAKIFEKNPDYRQQANNVDNNKEMRGNANPAWTGISIGETANQESDGRHKGYVTLSVDSAREMGKNLEQTFKDLYKKLKDAGYNGHLKMPGVYSDLLTRFDNIVIHGATKGDISLALPIIEQYFKDKGLTVEGTKTGIDAKDSNGKETSHTNLLAEKVKNKQLKSEQSKAPTQYTEAAAAAATTNPVDAVTMPDTTQAANTNSGYTIWDKASPVKGDEVFRRPTSEEEHFGTTDFVSMGMVEAFKMGADGHPEAVKIGGKWYNRKEWYDFYKKNETAPADSPIMQEEPTITEPPLPAEIKIAVSGVGPSTTPELNNIAPMDPPENGLYHAGYKIVDAWNTGATSTIAYHEGKDAVNKKALRKIQNPQQLNKINEDILNPLKLLPGTELEFVVDLDYDGPKLTLDNDNYEATTNETEKGADYIGKNGKVKTHPRMVGNVPIKVVDKKTGKTLFHLRKLDWLEMEFPGTSDKRNVVEFIKVGNEVINNYEIQLQLLMDIRKRIVDKFNKEGKNSTGKIAAQGKGTGRLILNHVVEKMDDGTIKSTIVPEFAMNKKDPSKSMLPENGTLAIADTGGEAMVGRGHGGKFKGELGFDKSGLVKGAVGQLVRAANGKYMWAPLIGVMNLEEGKPSAALNTIVRAIELYLLNDGTIPEIGDEIKKLQSNTGFNIATSAGLRAFINQYFTYMNGFPDSSVLPGAGETTERFLFNVDDGLSNIADKTRQIKAAFTLRGSGVQYANLLNGKLHPAFVQVLSEGLATRPKAVVWTDPSLGIRGINSSGSFTDAIYVPGKDWVHEKYDSYNHYIKTFSRTTVYGRNQLSDGTYVYTANPQLPMDFTDTNNEASLVVEPNTSATTPVVEQTEPSSGLLDSLFGYENMNIVVAKEIGTAPENSKELTLESLREMYNFTPGDERNGKTPMEVYEDLRARGHSYIPDGFNPFSRCL